MLGPGHCVVVVVDNEKGSQGWAGEAERSVVVVRERRGGGSREAGASSLPHPPPPMNSVVAGRGKEEAGSLAEEVGIGAEVHPPHLREAMPIGWSLCKDVSSLNNVYGFSKSDFPNLVL